MVKRFTIGNVAESRELAIVKRYTIGNSAGSLAMAKVKRFTIVEAFRAIRASDAGSGP
jgi:hypothetical protein